MCFPLHVFFPLAHNHALTHSHSLTHHPTDDVDALVAEQEASADPETAHLFADVQGDCSCAARLVAALLEGVAMMPPPALTCDARVHSHLLHHLLVMRSSRSFSAECMHVVRELLGVPAWRGVVASVLQQALSGVRVGSASPSAASPSSDHSLGDGGLGADAGWSQLRAQLWYAAALSVLGGHFDCLRLGGMVRLRPFALVDPGAPVAAKQASCARASGMLVAVGSTHVEVVELERGYCFRKLDPADATEGTGPLSEHERVVQQTACLSGPLPVRSIKLPLVRRAPPLLCFSVSLYLSLFLSYSHLPFFFLPSPSHALQADVGPQADVQLLPELLPPMLFVEVLRALVEAAVPWWHASSAEGNGKDTADRDSQGSGDNDSPKGSASAGSEVVELTETETAETVSDVGEEEAMALAAASELQPDSNVLAVLMHLSTFRSAAAMLQNSSFAQSLAADQPSALRELLALASRETRCGGLSVLEAAERRWNDLWDAYCSTVVPLDDANDSGAAEPNDEASGGGRSVGSGPSGYSPRVGVARIAQRLGAAADNSLTRSILLEAAAAVSLFSPSTYAGGAGGNPGRVGGAAAGPDPATQAAAVAQMVEMGLPPEWCDTALRRCRYNVEMAINLCFEHGEGMAQMVAEDALMQTARAEQAANRAAGGGGAPRSAGSSRGGEGGGGSAGGQRRASRGSSAARGQGQGPAALAQAQQLEVSMHVYESTSLSLSLSLSSRSRSHSR